MARPQQIGFNFFPEDTDTFSDRKIKKLLRDHKGYGFTIYHSVKCEAYRDKGYYVEWDDDYCFDIADSFHIDEDRVRAIIEYCVEIDLFSKEKFGQGILTSRGIQRRWLAMTEKSKRKGTKIKPEYLVEGVFEVKSGVSSEETEINPEETKGNSLDSTQSKIKERIEKETKGKNISLRENFFNEVLEIFYFKNWKDPWKVAETFFTHYEKAGWVDANKNEVKDPLAAARNWNNLTTQGKNSSDSVLKNWQIAFKIIKSKSPDYWLFLYTRVKFRMSEQLSVIEINEQTRQKINANKALLAIFADAFKVAFTAKQEYTVEAKEDILPTPILSRDVCESITSN